MFFNSSSQKSYKKFLKNNPPNNTAAHKVGDIQSSNVTCGVTFKSIGLSQRKTSFQDNLDKAIVTKAIW